MKKYRSQALAIVLVILVVGSMIGFAIYARMARESERVVDERASTEANELVETIIGLLSTVDRDNLLDDEFLSFLDPDCNHSVLYDDECRVSNLSIERLNEIFSFLGLTGVDLSEFDVGYCSVELALRYLSGSEGVNIPQDYAHSVFFHGTDWKGSCNEVEFTIERLGTDTKGFVVSSFYGDSEKGYHEYEHEHIWGGLYYGTDDNWQDELGNSHKIKFSDEENLYEARFKSLGGQSKLTWSTSGSCAMGEYVAMEVGANCGSKYVGKHFIILPKPFAPPIFDYVFFSGEGDLILEDDI